MGYWELSVNELFHSHLQIRTQWWRGVLNVKIQQTGEKKIKWILPSKDWCSPLFEFVVCLLSISSLQWFKLNPQNTPTHTLALTQLPVLRLKQRQIDQVCQLSELSHQLTKKHSKTMRQFAKNACYSIPLLHLNGCLAGPYSHVKMLKRHNS